MSAKGNTCIDLNCIASLSAETESNDQILYVFVAIQMSCFQEQFLVDVDEGEVLLYSNDTVLKVAYVLPSWTNLKVWKTYIGSSLGI